MSERIGVDEMSFSFLYCRADGVDVHSAPGAIRRLHDFG